MASESIGTFNMTRRKCNNRKHCQEKMSPHIKKGNCFSIAAVEMNYGKNILIEMNSGRKKRFCVIQSNLNDSLCL